MLLHWCTLEPAGPDGLAAIRFSAPVRVHSICIFPTNAQPFKHQPDITSRTEPESFFLDLYFNAQPVPGLGAKDRPKGTNALVHSVIAYAGGQMEFSAGMGAEYATRLMIVKGSFESVSMAIYGDVVHDVAPTTEYVPSVIPAIEPTPLSRALDPSNSRDPSHLARQLLSLIPDAPPLPLVIRLMFCLKPSNEDWDSSEFPYIHPDLDEADSDDFDLELASKLTSRPVADDVSEEVLDRFAANVSQVLKAKDPDQRYFVADILCNAASQHPNMAKALLRHLDLRAIFSGPELDENTLVRLTYAATNPDVARSLNGSWMQELINISVNNSQNDVHTAQAAKELSARIQAWAVLEDALTNTQADFMAAAAAIKEIGSDEQSFGIWIESMVMHEEVVSALAESPVLPIPLTHPPLLLRSRKASVSHDEFVAFMRAFVGVSCVLAVYAWADSLPHEACRERVLGIIRLWQGVDGYKEIVEHLLLLRQMIFRLECMLESDCPTRAGIDAERILVELGKDPQAILRRTLYECVLSLKPPYAFITDEERLIMREVALIAEDGLPGAVDELLRPVERPVTLLSLRALRVALAVVNQALEDRGEWDVLQEYRQEGTSGFISTIADVFLAISHEIASQFSLDLPGNISQELMHQSFRTADDLLRLLVRLVPAYPLPSRMVRALTIGVANLFGCTDAVDTLYSQSSPTCIAAQETRQSCIDIVRILSDPSTFRDTGILSAEVVLRTLLEHGLRAEDRDPAHHLLQVFYLIDYLLPSPELEDAGQSVWIPRVIGKLIRELWRFLSSLDTENKVHFVRRLVHLDQGVTGVGDWLLLEELKTLVHTLQLLDSDTLHESERIAREYQASASINFLAELVRGSSNTSAWCIKTFGTVHDVTFTSAACLTLLLDQHLYSPRLADVARALASSGLPFPPELRFLLVLTLLRSAHERDTTTADTATLLDLARTMLPSLSPEDIEVDKLRSEMGGLMAHVAASPDLLTHAAAEALVEMIEWVIATSKSGLPQLSVLRCATPVSDYCKALRNAVASDHAHRVDQIEAEITVTGEGQPAPVPSHYLADSVTLSLYDIEELLRSNIPLPSTPPKNALKQDVLGLVTISPPAIIRSPASTGLTKTYSNNDFRQLRQAPSARQNTSRLPSMHVDDFESGSSPTLAPLTMPTMPTTPYVAESFQGLAPAFSPV